MCKKSEFIYWKKLKKSRFFVYRRFRKTVNLASLLGKVSGTKEMIYKGITYIKNEEVNIKELGFKTLPLLR